MNFQDETLDECLRHMNGTAEEIRAAEATYCERLTQLYQSGVDPKLLSDYEDGLDSMQALSAMRAGEYHL